MDISSLLSMSENGPNHFLIQSIGQFNSQTLSVQQRKFHQALRAEGEVEVFYFYETMLSPTAQKNKHGMWKMTGPVALLVTKASATHCRGQEIGAEHMCAINRTHSNMVKFEPHDNEYEKARVRLIGLARRAVANQGQGSVLGHLCE